MATSVKRHRSVAFGEVLGGVQLFGLATDRIITIELPPEVDTLWRGARGWGHMGRMYGRSYPVSIPQRDEGTIESVVLEFSTSSGGVQGKIRTDVQRPILVSLDFTDDEHGSGDGKLVLSEWPDFPLRPYSIVTVRADNDADPVYKGIIQFPETEGSKSGPIDFVLVGLREQLKRMSEETTYSLGTDIGAIVADLAQNVIAAQSSISYDAGKINTSTGIYSSSDIDLHVDNMEKVMDTFSRMTNHDYGVDSSGAFFFLPKPTEVTASIFEGYGVGEIRAEPNMAEVVNVWRILRKQSKADGGAGYTIGALVRDETSQAINGLREKDFMVPGSFPDDVCEELGAKLLAETKDPQTYIEIQDRTIRTSADFVDRGLYRIVRGFGTFTEVATDVESEYEWNLTQQSAGDLDKFTEGGNVVGGAAALKLTWTDAYGSYVETVDGVVDLSGVFLKVYAYVQSSRAGTIFRMGVGLTNWDENVKDFDIPVSGQYYLVEWDISALDLDTIQRIGFEVIDPTVAATTAYIDSVFVQMKGNKHYLQQRTRAKYSLTAKRKKVDLEFGPAPRRLYETVGGLIAQAEENKLHGEVR